MDPSNDLFYCKVEGQRGAGRERVTGFESLSNEERSGQTLNFLSLHLSTANRASKFIDAALLEFCGSILQAGQRC